jgi:hypothetical protein
MLCPLCLEQSANWPTPNSRSRDVNCQICGKFEITDEASHALHEDTDAETTFALACWVYEQNMFGGNPRIDIGVLKFIRTYPRPNMKKRAELYLGRAIRQLEVNL